MRIWAGSLNFGPHSALGLGISFIAGVLYVVSWDIACAIAHLDFAGSYAKAMIAQQQAKGASAEALVKLTAEMEQFKIQYANPLYRWPMTFAGNLSGRRLGVVGIGGAIAQ